MPIIPFWITDLLSFVVTRSFGLVDFFFISMCLRVFVVGLVFFDRGNTNSHSSMRTRLPEKGYASDSSRIRWSKSGFSRQSDAASSGDHAMPGKPLRSSQGPDYLPGSSGKSGRFVRRRHSWRPFLWEWFESGFESS